MKLDLLKVTKEFDRTEEQSMLDASQKTIDDIRGALGEKEAKEVEKLIRNMIPVLRQFYHAGAQQFCSLVLDQIKSSA